MISNDDIKIKVSGTIPMSVCEIAELMEKNEELEKELKFMNNCADEWHQAFLEARKKLDIYEDEKDTLQSLRVKNHQYYDLYCNTELKLEESRMRVELLEKQLKFYKQSWGGNVKDQAMKIIDTQQTIINSMLPMLETDDSIPKGMVLFKDLQQDKIVGVYHEGKFKVLE
jgi:predicted RNase H-like nuclease (RuvC/YqgF family)